ncbi:ribokinase [Methylacidiphilum caldifontis]|uniref:ribokinase n=1 Tax=Methylacidiphilum caldifontis TaxID=2795386 RepID=UPI001A8CDBC6|nr:ribokinase [Methylacidiphilum caldifontis]QSR88970.1 ribokinase [Methylacidiphilum caldifontis]
MLWIVGSCNIDLTVRVESFPKVGETILARESAIAVGGKGANQAVAAALWNVKPKFISCVGKDAWGKTVCQKLQHYGLDVSLIAVSEKHPTGMAWIEIDKKGDNRITVAPGANLDLVTDQVLGNMADLSSADYLLAQLEVPLQVVEAAFEYAKKRGSKTILNPSPCFEGLSKVFSLTDYLVLNETECCKLAAVSSLLEEKEKTKSFFFQCGISVLVVTAGPQGAFVFERGGQSRHVRPPLVQVVDSSGAGDAFLGTFTSWLVMGKTLVKALKAAVVSGALACTRKGTMSSLPDPKEVLLHLS